jgi:23S rRNA pseudouridine955/2504/2580 synthase
MKEIRVTKENENQRIDKFVKKYLNLAPLSFIYKVFRKKDVKVNDHWVKENYILKNNDVIKIYVTDDQISEFNKPRDITKMNDVKLDIIYEDKNILVINKPKGILVISDINESNLTLTNLVQSYLFNKGEFKNDGTVYRPSPVHRLDRNTSGICLFAKNLMTSQVLLDLFKEHDEIDKYYLALVVGHPFKNKDLIDAPLLKNEETKTVRVASYKEGAKEAKTEYEVISKNNDLSLLKVHLLTGRTHQIRVHLAYINTPIVGDAKYGDFAFNKKFEDEFKYRNQFLHSYKFVFGKMDGELAYLTNKEFIADLPTKEKEILDAINLKYSLDRL